jgi:hypothetical protein
LEYHLKIKSTANIKSRLIKAFLLISLVASGTMKAPFFHLREQVEGRGGVRLKYEERFVLWRNQSKDELSLRSEFEPH